MRRLSSGVLLFAFLVGLSGCDDANVENIANESNLSLEQKDIRILAGKEADADAWSWMVGLIDLTRSTDSNYKGFSCGGTLIDEKWILTAAHCVSNIENFSELKILLGTNDLTEDIEPVSIKQFIVHPDYNPKTIDSDIALIELEEPVNFPKVSMKLNDTSLNNKRAIAIGWGATNRIINSNISSPEKLQQISLSVVSNQTCNASYADIITENMLCAGINNKSKGTYKGDSGGPLVIYNGDNWELIGVTSWGDIERIDNEFIHQGNYSVFTRVSKFKEWISSNINTDNLADLKPLNKPSWTAPLVVTKTQCSSLKCIGNNHYGETDILHLSFAIQNSGKQDPDNIVNMKIGIYYDNYKIGNLEINPNNKNENNWSSLNMQLGNFPLGTHTFKMVIDDEDNVYESDETNNEYSYTFTIGDTQKDADYYLDSFYSEYKSFFGAKLGDAYDCGYSNWRCQNFISGKKISAHIGTFDLVWWNGTKWIKHGRGSDIY